MPSPTLTPTSSLLSTIMRLSSRSPTKRRTRPPFPPILVLLPFVFIFLVALFLPRLPLPSLTPRSSPPEPAPDLCLHVSAPTPPNIRFNSRSLCLSSSLCLSENPSHVVYHSHSSLSETQCEAVNPQFLPIDGIDHTAQYGSCSALQRDTVVCAHGTGLLQDNPECPRVEERVKNENATRWLEDITILVPDFPYTDFIYHYASMAATLSHVVSSIDDLVGKWGRQHVLAPGGIMRYFRKTYDTVQKVNVLFRMEKPDKYTQWKEGLLRTLVEQQMSKKVDIELHYGIAERPGGYFTCMRNAVVLGRMGHCNAMIFMNSTNVRCEGDAAPKEAVAFKRALWDGHGVEGKLPGEGLATLPSLVVGYAKREGKSDEDGYFRSGNIRRFDNDTEKWFDGMLREEAGRVGARVEVFMPKDGETFGDQVRRMQDIGFVVGIHGANLVNSIFMRPYAAFLEILPNKVGARCYIGGSNSGLRYYRHMTYEEVGWEESGCDPKDGECQVELRQRMVRVTQGAEREKVRAMIRDGLNYIKGLHNMYPDGIPTRLNPESGNFETIEKAPKLIE